jgi:ElaB/YqjD/DUF883 family membrane-anchored ribosome-binding protein
MSEASGVDRDKLVADVKLVLADAEEMLRLAAGDTTGKFAEVKGRLSEKLALARARIQDAEESVVARTREAAKATDTYVHENPWQSVGVAAGVGFLVGLLIGRR